MSQSPGDETGLGKQIAGKPQPLRQPLFQGSISGKKHDLGFALMTSYTPPEALPKPQDIAADYFAWQRVSHPWPQRRPQCAQSRSHCDIAWAALPPTLTPKANARSAARPDGRRHRLHSDAIQIRRAQPPLE